MTRTDKISLTLIFIFSAINIFWVYSLPVLPFVDLPFHLAESIIIKNFDNPALLFNKFFAIPTLIKSNIFYMYFCSLSIFPNVEFASRIFYSIYILIFPLSVFTLIKTLKGNTLFSLLSFLFLINHNVHWGFVSYTMSVPVLFLTFSSFYQYFIQNKLKYAYYIWIMFIITFTLHFQMAIFSILIFSLLTLVYQWRELKQIIINIASVLPVLAIMVYAYLQDSHGDTTPLLPYMLSYYTSNYFTTLLDRFMILLVIDNSFILGGPNGAYHSLILTIPIVLFFIYFLIKSKTASLIYTVNNKFLFILTGITFACYIFLPDIIPGQNVIFERYSVILFLLIITLISAIRSSDKSFKYIQIIIPLLILAQSVIILDYMLDFKKSTSDFSKDIFPNTSKRKLAGIMLDNDFRGSKIYAHFPMYYTVWYNGITAGLIDYRFGLIKRNVSVDTLPVYKEWIDNSINFDEYYKPVDFLLVKSREDLKLQNFSPERESGKWKLYKSNKDL
ncbi:MAG: hypothetical protein NTY74_10040 [Ignavibacteriae bacterium]|nr:hypothetical protein [Ignavibacteriota bacterium]